MRDAGAPTFREEIATCCRTVLLSLVAISTLLTFIPPPLKAENQHSGFLYGGIHRTYILHVPRTGLKDLRLPLIIVLHGGGGTGKGMLSLTFSEFDSLADRDTAVVVYPDGVNRSWRDGRANKEDLEVDDVGFIAALIDSLERTLNVDPRRVYVTGISNGAMMTYRLACDMSERFAAVAPVDGAIPEEIAEGCSPEAPLSLLAINNTEDPLVHWEGGDVTGPFGMRKLGKVLSVKQSVETWVARNGCSTTPVVSEEPDRDPDDRTRIQKEMYGGGKEGTEVILYAVKGGGHTWPGGLQYAPASIIGRTSKDMNACQVIWDFFKTHTR